MMFRATAVALIAAGVDGATAPPWASRSEIPSGCAVQVKVPEQGRCLFDDQCKTGFCCPYFRSCLGEAGLQQTPVKDMGDTLRMAIVWGEGGARGSYNGQQLNTSANGGTDVCSRTNAASQDIGRCGPYSTSSASGIIALKDSGSFIKGFDLTHAQCECDSRFTDLYKAGTWTGTFENGTFRNYCDPTYYLADGGSVNCPSGWVRIVDLTECKTAITYLGLGDATAYLDGKHGADKFPGCVNNKLNNQVAFNVQNTATTDFAVTTDEQYVCKKGASSGTTAAAGGATAAPTATTTVKYTAELTVNDPEAFVKDARVAEVLSNITAGALGVSPDSVSVLLRLLSARRLDGEQRRLAGGVAADYTIAVAAESTNDIMTKVSAAKPADLTAAANAGLAAKLGAGTYTMEVKSVSAPTVAIKGSVTSAGPRAGMSLAAAALAIFLAGRA